ncbi:cadherin repeat domain-containing protein [Algibacter sp. AS12]|uniref:cadherin repeat domain-containing protein n=1 Tax=Algibacter sp. AS12 TaxID=3135773 RepID=UPI00398BA822
MKNSLKPSSFFVLIILLFTYSCGSDDDSSASNKIIVENLVTNFDENPTINASIGTIQATSNYTLSFSISSQTPAGALKINSSTGELSVADTAVFDFETNQIINAVISISDKNDSATAIVTININDLDDTIIVENLVTNFDENPITDAVIATIQATSTKTLSFTISSQTPDGALKINPITGELSVADPIAFDFETNPIISASISIIDAIDTASATATINLNNLDDIASFLTTSQADYLAAADGTWIIIEEAEYNALANKLNAVTKAATSDDDYIAYQTSNLNAPTSFTCANNNGSTMPTNSYVFAFKTNNHAVSTINKVKLSSTSVSDGFTDLGSDLPANEANTNNYFVLKGSNTPTTDVGYLGLYSNNSLKYKNVVERNVATGPGDVNTLPNSVNQVVLYQGLSTTQKQW